MADSKEISGRLFIYDKETHLEASSPLAVGQQFEVIRGNGPREGQRMGIATLMRFNEHGLPDFHIKPDS
jgi:hypothetical protein